MKKVQILLLDKANSQSITRITIYCQVFDNRSKRVQTPGTKKWTLIN